MEIKRKKKKKGEMGGKGSREEKYRETENGKEREGEKKENYKSQKGAED